MTILLLMGLTLLIPLMAGIPIAIVLGGSGLLWIWLLDPIYLRGVGHTVWNTSITEVLTSIPLFILMGELIQRSGIATRFYDAVSIWLRRLPGGLLHANIAASSIFAAVSGSSVATAATIGTASIPNLLRLGYEKRLTLGSIAAGGTLGILIPPSVPLIVYGALVEVSIGRLFIAALIPGLLMGLLFSIYIAIVGVLRPGIAPPIHVGTVSFRDRLRSLGEMAPLVTIILVILGGIYFGWTTPTEAAALGVFISLVVAIVQRRATRHVLVGAIVSSIRFTAMIMFVIIGAQIFSFAIFSWGLNVEVVNWISQLAYPPLGILLIIIVMYLVLGMFIDPLSIMIMTLSILFPVILHLGYDPIWFGVLLVILLEIGLITPPVGINLYAIQGIDPKRLLLRDVAVGATPFILLMLVGVGALIAFPEIALWLPTLMFAR